MSIGCSLNVNAVTTPKFPPPPRSAQNKSEFSSAFALTKVPLAKTTSAETRLSMLNPHLRVRCRPLPQTVIHQPPLWELFPLAAPSPTASAAYSPHPHVIPRLPLPGRPVGSTLSSLS